MSEGEKKEAELSASQSDDDESINKQQTTILEQVILKISIWSIACVHLFAWNLFNLLQTAENLISMCS